MTTFHFKDQFELEIKIEDISPNFANISYRLKGEDGTDVMCRESHILPREISLLLKHHIGDGVIRKAEDLRWK